MENIVFTEELMKVMGATSYQGCLIEQKADGFYVGGLNRGLTLASAKAYIEQRFKDLNASFKAPVDTTTHHFNEKGLVCR